jgi:peptide deformylase
MPSSAVGVFAASSPPPDLSDYHDPTLPNWHGTSLPGPLSLSEACAMLLPVDNADEHVLNMGRWPDPILRMPSSNIPLSAFRDNYRLGQLRSVASALRNTALREGAVGLAAQQCGLGVSLIYIDGVNGGGVKNSDNASRDSTGHPDASGVHESRGGVSGEGKSPDRFSALSARSLRRSKRENGENGIFLANPRIIHRSPESDMLVWTEQCLVLPPEFRASLLRDAEVVVEYESLDDVDAGQTKQIKLRGELARCAQHEMDHDRGILIVDHVTLDELLSVDGKPIMAEIENRDGLHARRMQQAYSREVTESSLLPKGQKMVTGFHERVAQYEHPHIFVQSASAIDQVKQQSTSSVLYPLRRIEEQCIGRSQTVTDEIPTLCDSTCQEERRRVVEQRRAMMKQSRSNTRRADILELSEQRASLYGTGFRGLPPKLCSGFCP